MKPDSRRVMFFDVFPAILRNGGVSVAVSRHACRAAATAVLVGLTACATTPATPEAKQAAVSQRAVAKWDAMIKDDIAAAYGYMSPASRQVVTLDRFRANVRRGAFREAKVDRVTCEGDVCQVRMLVTYDHKQMKGITTPLTESWVFDGGEAWFVYR
jgi:hypothetical protein